MNHGATSVQTLEYWVDAQDRLIRIADGWDSTAQTNGASSLTAANVLHQSLWSFISDRTTRFIYRLLLDRVRLRRIPIRLTARGDSPTQRCTIAIEMHPEANLHVHFISTVIQTEPRAPVALLDNAVPRSQDLVVICSWCKRLELPNGQWVEIEEALNQVAPLRNGPPLPKLSHGMCVDCLIAMKQEIARQT